MSTVLFLTRELPAPRNAGDRIVTNGFIRCLSQAGHDVHLLSYASDDDESRISALRESCQSIVRVPGTDAVLPPPFRRLVRGIMGHSDVMDMFYADAFSEATAHRIDTLTPDIVVAQHPYIGQVFLDRPVRQAAHRADARLVTSAHVVEYAAHQRYYEHTTSYRTRLALALEIPRLRQREMAVYRASDQTVVLSETDKRTLNEAGINDVHHQRVALDVASYDAEAAGKGTASPRLVFFGSYDWFPNEDAVTVFTNQVFSRIRAVHPDVTFAISGRGASDSVRRLGSNPGVEFTGEHKDIASFIREADVMVAPLRIGGGVRLKVLETMALGTPIVSTAAGFDGVCATPGEDAIVASDWNAFVSGVCHLLDCPTDRTRLATSARQTVEECYDISVVAPRLESTLGL